MHLDPSTSSSPVGSPAAAPGDGAEAGPGTGEVHSQVDWFEWDTYVEIVESFFELHTLDLILTVVFLLTAVIADIVQRFIIRRLRKRAERNDHEVRSIIAAAITGPLGFGIWITAITTSIQLYVPEDTRVIPVFYEYVGDIRILVIIALLAWFIARCLRRSEVVVVNRHQAANAEFDLTALQALMGFGVIMVWIIAVLVGFQSLGFNLAALLTIGGVGAAAIGFAAQDCISNFFGGLMVLFNAPFKVGDWIQSPDRELEGTVERIGLYATVVRSFDKRPIYVPNSIFLKAITVNPSRMTNRRIKFNLTLRYQDLDQVQAVSDAIKKMLTEHPEIDTAQTMLVNFTTYGDSSIDIMIYTFTKTTVWAKFENIRSDVLLRIGGIVKQHDADFAFPTRTIEFAGSPPQDVQPLGVSS